MPPEDQTIVGCLRVQHALQDHSNATATRLRVGRLLESASVRPPGLPPSAVLIVQYMADPLPGRLASGRHALSADTAWQRAAQRELEERFRHAAQPARGTIPANAIAVRFADESELMACLARDICRGLAGQRWWWRVVLRSAWSSVAVGAASDPRVGALVQELARQAHLAPATLARLHEWGEAIAVLRLFTSAQAAQVLHALLLAYHLPSLPGDQPHPWRARPQPPWTDPEARSSTLPASMGRERMALLGLALDLDARPQVVASDSYQRRLRAWWQAARRRGAIGLTEEAKDDNAAGDHAGRPSPARPAPEIAAGRRSDVAPAKTTSPLHAAAEAVAAAVVDAPISVQPAKSAPTAAHGRRGLAQGSEPGMAPAGGAPSSFSDLLVRQGSARAGRAVSAVETTPERAPSGVRTSTDEPGAASTLPASDHSVLSQAFALALGEGVPTQLGGILYLINLMVAHDLPACFEKGWRLATGVGPWGLLQALGQELLPSNADVAADLLWPALAHLDGRLPDQPPGARLPRSRPRRWPPFALTAGWLADLGFDKAPTPTQPAASAHRRRGLDVGLRTGYPPLLARWLTLALPFIERRLRLALDLPAEASLAAALLWLPGHLYVTQTHVDLVTSLEHISLPVRLAGLDRNPGWLPDFARVVTFHFT